MSSKAVNLAVKIVSDAERAADGVKAVDRAFDGMAQSAAAADRAVSGAATAADKIEQSSSKARRSVEDIAGSTDNLGSKAGTATGALGALSSGFELVGLSGYAEQLNQAAMATDFLSGVGDSLTLILESQALANARAKVAAIASGVAQRAQAAASAVVTGATYAQAVATRVLNAALRANPIGLIITAVLLLVAGFVLLYKRSETFRNIVQAVMRGAAAAVGWVVGAIGGLIGWVRDKLPGAFRAAQAVAGVVWRAITAYPRLVITVVSNLIGWVRDKLPGAWNTAKTTAVNAFNAIVSPIRKVIGWVQSLLDKIGSIHLPSVGGIFGGGGGGGIFGFASTGGATAAASPVGLMGARSLMGAAAAVGGGGAVGLGGLGRGTAPVQIIIQGAIDPDSTARQIERILGQRARRMGRGV